MSKVIVSGFSLSIDGYGAGPGQSRDDPLGKRGEELHRWMIGTAMFHEILGKDGGSEGVDNDYATRSMEGFGAFIMGRNMFGPSRGDWPHDRWKGWWGDNPPYHVPTFVLTHYPHEPIEMEGGTVFHFVTDGIEAALERAKAAAGNKNVKICGGASTIRQYLQAGLVNEMHLAISPVVLGQGEAVFAGLDLTALGFSVSEHAATEAATHILLAR